MCDQDFGSFHTNDNCRDLIKRYPPFSSIVDFPFQMYSNIISDSLIWTMLSQKTHFDFN